MLEGYMKSFIEESKKYFQKMIFYTKKYDFQLGN